MIEQLHQLDDLLRERKFRGGIKAVGILGSDVFDKLLLLRALRREFPDAIFFTTDFDELLTLQSERHWTRNLII